MCDILRSVSENIAISQIWGFVQFNALIKNNMHSEF
jgi:hypothetical protein